MAVGFGLEPFIDGLAIFAFEFDFDRNDLIGAGGGRVFMENDLVCVGVFVAFPEPILHFGFDEEGLILLKHPGDLHLEGVGVDPWHDGKKLRIVLIFNVMLTRAVDALTVTLYPDATAVAVAAAARIKGVILAAVAARGEARIIWATGNSQLACLGLLVADGGIPWERVICFHLDEYLGIAADHPGSFRHYLKTRLADLVCPQVFHYLRGDCLEPLEECDRYAQLLESAPIDLCCLGVGNNGHLGFNEPSVANFADPYAVKLVRLDAENRAQQYGQGHFSSLVAVPDYAFTLTLPAIFRCGELLCLAQGEHKGAIVAKLLGGAIAADCPASFLRCHPHSHLYLDKPAAEIWVKKPGFYEKGMGN